MSVGTEGGLQKLRQRADSRSGRLRNTRAERSRAHDSAPSRVADVKSQTSECTSESPELSFR
eukprot:15430071-Alexandrium_andersonii.AAC.1